MFDEILELKKSVDEATTRLEDAKIEHDNALKLLQGKQEEARKLLGFETSAAKHSTNIPKKWRMRVTPEQSRKVQEKVFAEGGKWYGGATCVRYTENPFLFYADSALTRGEASRHFAAHRYPEITPEQFLRGE